jgi:bifunctional UDP-N-acetylglucosamine pyrophosphorylase/glucosamine-1-phosphate N-acetyltransferase
MAKKEFSVIILAAGKGTRMKSPLPKVLHPVAGTPMIKKVIDAARGAGASEIRIVLGHGESLIRKVIEPMGVSCFVQTKQLGTADAVKSAETKTLQGTVLILNGDHPLLLASDLEKILTEFHENPCSLAVVTATLKNPGSLGRIVRHNGELHSIVETSDASGDTLKIREVNSGIYVTNAEVLTEYLSMIKNNNSKQEFYLTDLIEVCKAEKEKMIAIKAKPHVAFGVNTQKELSMATKVLFKRKSDQLMADGVLFIDPRNTYVEEECFVGPGSVLYPGVYLRGRSNIGAYCVLEPNCYLAHTKVDDGVHIKAGTYMEQAIVSARASIGPYAHLRPGTEIGVEAHIGNFVELKKTKFGARSKAGHLSYLGDASIGEDVNIGCGTITCNYAPDKKKYRTKIGDRVFVGSDSQLVAPVEIGNDALIASGSTITKDVPAKSLGIARARQENKIGFAEKFLAKDDTESSPQSK